LRRKLWLLDIALLALVVLAGTALRGRWVEGRGREEALLKRIVPVPPPPPIAPLPTISPSTASQYIDVAQHMVFSRDRNPNVILDPPAPPPPPKPMPDLPVAYGVLNLGAGPMAILSEKSGAEHRGYKAGEKIGEFKVYALNNQEIVFEWDGKYVKKTIQELADVRPTVPQPGPEETQQAPAQSQPTNISAPKGPGVDMGNATRACAPGDSNPPGTVQDGMRKVVTKTPFGDSCRWEPAK
jgi:hypothetical protein